MILGKVIGPVVATKKHPVMHARKMLAVQPINKDQHKAGTAIIALDTVQAGPGDIVLVIKEGKGSAQLLDYPQAPINCTIVGIVD